MNSMLSGNKSNNQSWNKSMLENRNLLLHCTESLKRNDIEHFVYRWQMNITDEF